MKYRAALALIVATLLATRALVPVGYMLGLPAGGGSGVSLIFCPSQNAGLDLTLFADTEPGAAHHAHHTHGEAPAAGQPDGPYALEVQSDCALWLVSGEAWAAPYGPPQHSALRTQIAYPWLVRFHRGASPAPQRARAPPHHRLV